MDSISGLGHTWPPATDLNQAEEIGDFFKQFSLQDKTGVYQQPHCTAPKPVSAAYPAGIIRLKGIEENVHVRIVDSRGRLVTTATAVDQRLQFKNRAGGVVVLMVEQNGNPESIKVVVP